MQGRNFSHEKEDNDDVYFADCDVKENKILLSYSSHSIFRHKLWAFFEAQLTEQLLPTPESEIKSSHWSFLKNILAMSTAKSIAKIRRKLLKNGPFKNTKHIRVLRRKGSK